MNNRLLGQFTRIFLINTIVLFSAIFIIAIFSYAYYPEIYDEQKYEQFDLINNQLFDDIHQVENLIAGEELTVFYSAQYDLYSKISTTSGKELYASAYINALQNRNPNITSTNGEEIQASVDNMDVRFYHRTYTILIDNHTYVLDTYFKILTEDQVLQPMRNVVLTLLLSSIGIAVIVSFLIVQFIRKPMSILADKAKAISELDFENNLSWKSNDDMGRLSDSLDDMQEKLKHAMKYLEDDSFVQNELLLEEQRQRVAILSHELNTPLTVLKMQNELLLESEQSDINRMYLRRNLQKVDDVTKMVDQILRYKDVDDSELIVINDIVDSLIKFDYDATIFKFDYIDDCEIEASPIYVKRLIINLISNSIKYNYGSEPIMIRIEKSQFTIINSCDEQLDASETQLLMPYVRANNNKEIQGQGLGLYICSKICALQHFKFKVKTENGKFIATIKF